MSSMLDYRPRPSLIVTVQYNQYNISLFKVMRCSGAWSYVHACHAHARCRSEPEYGCAGAAKPQLCFLPQLSG
jgi:hypothetical protein